MLQSQNNEQHVAPALDKLGGKDALRSQGDYPATFLRPAAAQGRGGYSIRVEYITDQDLSHVLALLMPQNRLICQLALRTGLRVGDILAMRTANLRPRMTITERKTGKRKRISIPPNLYDQIAAQAGKDWVFVGRDDSRPKTRQAIWADLKRAQKALRLPSNLGTHSMRKIYAVRLMERYGDVAKVMRALNHDNETTTMIYAMADMLAAKRLQDKRRR